MTVNELRREGKNKLAESGIRDADTDSVLILEHVLKTDRNHILLNGNSTVDSGSTDAYRSLIEKRMKHIPLQHITGRQGFMGFDFIVDENVLIPRQDTECLVEEALRELNDGMKVLDLCTGSGCVIISIAGYKNDIDAVGTDISGEALEIAERNAGLNKQKVRFCRGDLYEGLHNIGEYETKFDAIVSNPPYIRSDVIPTLMEEVREHEPLKALDGGSDGLDFYRRIIEEARHHLTPGGCILFEIGYDQAEAVTELFESRGYRDIETVKDYSGNDRVVKARLPIVMV
ncbi:MAG: peptide chain release factor N(5)-glutamine methyltransferase [Lachnospiraceae bacterium]|nr:peptide chain release factor N(5)-glutamine methyltransferase [Lachnospiraceae bacterium]